MRIACLIRIRLLVPKLTEDTSALFSISVFRPIFAEVTYRSPWLYCPHQTYYTRKSIRVHWDIKTYAKHTVQPNLDQYPLFKKIVHLYSRSLIINIWQLIYITPVFVASVPKSCFNQREKEREKPKDWEKRGERTHAIVYGLLAPDLSYDLTGSPRSASQPYDIRIIKKTDREWFCLPRAASFRHAISPIVSIDDLNLLGVRESI